MNRIITYALFGINQNFILEFKEGIENVQEGDVLQAAQRHLHPKQQPIVVVADAKAIRKDLETLGIPIIDWKIEN